MHRQTDPDADARSALRLIGPDPQNWVPERPGVDHNVTIVGGGQSGSAFAFALRRAGIGKVSVIDAAENEARAGVWLTAVTSSSDRRASASVTGSAPPLTSAAWYAPISPSNREGMKRWPASASAMRYSASREPGTISHGSSPGE